MGEGLAIKLAKMHQSLKDMDTKAKQLQTNTNKAKQEVTTQQNSVAELSSQREAISARISSFGGDAGAKDLVAQRAQEFQDLIKERQTKEARLATAQEQKAALEALRDQRFELMHKYAGSNGVGNIEFQDSFDRLQKDLLKELKFEFSFDGCNMETMQFVQFLRYTRQNIATLKKKVNELVTGGS